MDIGIDYGITHIRIMYTCSIYIYNIVICLKLGYSIKCGSVKLKP